MKRKAVLIEDMDTVLTVLEDVAAGDIVSTGSEEITALEDIPQYHKIARRTIQLGEVLYKYGSPMGYATAQIAQGQWVHTHNADSVLPERGDV